MADIEGLQRKFEKELASGTVSLVLLAVLGRASEPLYGYQIAKALEQPDGGVLAGKQSALYPVLGNLEGAGLLDSHIELSVAGPPRRYYRINDDGRQVLAQWKAAWDTTATACKPFCKERIEMSQPAHKPQPLPRSVEQYLAQLRQALAAADARRRRAAHRDPVPGAPARPPARAAGQAPAGTLGLKKPG